MWELILSPAFWVDFLSASIRMTAPLTFAGLCCVISERSGVFNIGVEGIMLGGALAAAIGALFSGNAWIGIALAIVVGAFMGLLLGLLTITFGANQIVSGVMITILALGLTSFLAPIIMGTAITEKLPPLQPWRIPILWKVPVLGHLLFSQSPLSYISYIIAIVLTYIFLKTTWGLSIRAVGEHPRAADTAGINVFMVKYFCVIFSGIFASLGGALLSIDLVRYFTENMTAGRGFIGLTIVILGKWHPLGVLLAAFFFGAVDAFQLRIQVLELGIPYHFLLMLPYICGLVAVSGVITRPKAPAALGKPYRKEA